MPRAERLDDFVEVLGMRVFLNWPDRKAIRVEGSSSQDYERTFRAPERPFSMGTSRIPNTDHEHAIWKQDLDDAEQEGLRFILAHSAVDHGRRKIAVALRTNGFLRDRRAPARENAGGGDKF